MRPRVASTPLFTPALLIVEGAISRFIEVQSIYRIHFHLLMTRHLNTLYLARLLLPMFIPSDASKG